MEPKDKKEQADGVWQNSDFFEADPEYQDLYDDQLITFLEKENPELLGLMKDNGLDGEDDGE